MDEFYNKHYIKTRDDGAIINYWSDGPHPNLDTADAVCINEHGSYQAYLTIDGVRTEENPNWLTSDGIPLYKWDGQAVVKRTAEEIAADRAAIPAPPSSEMEQLRQEVARLSDENAQLQQEQTDLQMALCDTYELLLGGNDNG